MLQHRQSHGHAERQEFSQSGDHHPQIRQPVHVRNKENYWLMEWHPSVFMDGINSLCLYMEKTLLYGILKPQRNIIISVVLMLKLTWSGCSESEDLFSLLHGTQTDSVLFTGRLSMRWLKVEERNCGLHRSQSGWQKILMTFSCTALNFFFVSFIS